jgi:hypothetical protein
VPAEYLDLVSRSQEMTINGWRIHDLEHVRKMVQPDQNYYLLAEKDGCGAIAVTEEGESGEIFYLDYEDEKALKIKTSLREFLQQEQKHSK